MERPNCLSTLLPVYIEPSIALFQVQNPAFGVKFHPMAHRANLQPLMGSWPCTESTEPLSLVSPANSSLSFFILIPHPPESRSLIDNWTGLALDTFYMASLEGLIQRICDEHSLRIWTQIHSSCEAFPGKTFLLFLLPLQAQLSTAVQQKEYELSYEL